MQARDVMTTSVESVKPDTTVYDVARLMAAKRISGVPVVDESGQVVGMITEGDLLRRAELGTEQQAGWVRIFTSKAKQADDYVRTLGRVATDVMSRGVVTAAPSAPLSEVVDLMERNRVKRILVTEGGRLVGIISRGNLVQVLAAASPETEGTATDDYRIRDAVLAEFRRQPWGLKSDSNVIVSNGVVHLWGLVSTQQEQAALRVAAESIPGVRRVADHTILSTENTSDSAARPTQ